MTICDIALGVLCIVLIARSPRNDPAIRWKERMDKLKAERETR